MANNPVSAKRIQLFLGWMANANGPDDWMKVYERFPEFFAAGTSALFATAPERRDRRTAHLVLQAIGLMRTYVEQLRDIWRETDLRLRQWKLFVLRTRFHSLYLEARDIASGQVTESAGSGWPNTPPELTPFEQAMFYLDRHPEQFRYCNNPDCSEPYYFTLNRHATRYCSPGCTGPAKKAAKLRWYYKKKEGK